MPSFTSPRVLRIARSDDPEAFVLVHVSHTGPETLDLALTATEGESPYTGLVKQSQLRDFRAKNYQGTDDEWSQVVAFILGQGQRPIPANGTDWPAGVEASANISGAGDEEKEIVITVRKRVETITQRLGTFVLKQDDEQAVELFEWTGIAATRSDALDQQVASLTSRCHIAEDAIRHLNDQLEELVRAKSQHENQLIANFVHLLNEKKLKIRNQQRLLASANANPVRVSEIQAVTLEKSDAAAGKNRHGKRGAPTASDTSGDSDDGFERMDMDRKGVEDIINDQDTDNGRSTPQPLEEEEQSTTDDEFDRPPTGKGYPQAAPALKRSSPKEAPPRRELPFTRRTRPTNDAETSGETDDDEL
ncbi:hypothetical protein NUU61_002476 [Penicillium alfredii]|uniref:XRCC4 coiled-coil domain-containing protein n=1 Tax=Penicillium alfredii TaxID=1506179 RepID=A0A9W9FRM1_9EURO|nr:uncharacterized protein NUU61_002476 [Penicillium alfredii]KAJ5105129.1 hypothetical protein NUU61_002476 [Penicillium alfredii]